MRLFTGRPAADGLAGRQRHALEPLPAGGRRHGVHDHRPRHAAQPVRAMKVARIEYEGAARTAIVADDGVRVLAPEIGVLDVLADPSPRVRRAASREPRASSPRSSRRRSATSRSSSSTSPASSRTRARTPRCRRSGTSRRSATSATRTRSPVPETRSRCRRAASTSTSSSNWPPSSAAPGATSHPAKPRATSPATRSSTTGRRATSSATSSRSGSGSARRKDFANTLGPWIVTPDELEPYRRGDRLDLRMTAAINGRELGVGHRREHGLELGRARLLRLARDVGAARRRARLGHLRRRLPDGAVGPPRPRRLPAAAARRHRVSDHRGDRDAGEHGRRPAPTSSSFRGRGHDPDRLPRPRAAAGLPGDARRPADPARAARGLRGGDGRRRHRRGRDLDRPARARSWATAARRSSWRARPTRGSPRSPASASPGWPRCRSRTSTRRCPSWRTRSTRCRSTA